jgi:hypothetical protein
MPNTCVYDPTKKRSNIIKKSLHKHNKKCYTKGNNCKKYENKTKQNKKQNNTAKYNKTKKVIIKIDDKDYLKKFGYSTKLGKEDRHKVLLKAVEKYGYSSVIKRLVALRTLTKNTQPIKSNKYNNDIIGLQKWKKYIENMMKGGSINKNISKNLTKNNLTKINKLIKNILEIEKNKIKNNKK